MTMSTSTTLRDKVLAKKPSEKNVTVCGLTFTILGKSKRDRAAMFAKARKKDSGLDFERLESVMLAECVTDPDTKVPVASVTEWDATDSELTGPLVAACMSVLGMDKQDMSPKDSGSTETSS